MHIHRFTISALLLTTTAAVAQEADAPPEWGRPVGEDRILLSELDGFPDALLFGPVDDRGQRPRHDQIRIEAHGLVDLNPNRDDLLPAAPMRLARAHGPLIAPLWYDFDPACQEGPTDERVRYGVHDGALLIQWSGMTTGGRACDARAPVSHFSLRMEATPQEVASDDGTVVEGHTLRLTFTYHQLPITGAPRAGVSIEDTVLELFADEDRPRADRAHQLAALGGQLRPACPVDAGFDVARALAAHYPSDEAWSCVAEARCAADDRCTETPHFLPGRWVIELNPGGGLVGDVDRDGWRSADNCPEDFNPRQLDQDDDTDGNACDIDIDGDLVFNDDDNCPFTPHGNLTDTDGDGYGDVCDADDDADGLQDWIDLCPRHPDPTNGDLDGDGWGDVCDPDIDGDGGMRLAARSKSQDQCPFIPEPGPRDSDRDGLGDACDRAPWRACVGPCHDQRDSDGDGVLDIVDVCRHVPDDGRADCDGDGDGLGDACDPDANGDGLYDVLQSAGDRACRLRRHPLMLPPVRFGEEL